MKLLSIIVVALNPGEKLKETLESIAGQTFKDYEVIIKDGCSTDGSLEQIEESGLLKSLSEVSVFRKEDTGIYDGMNQAVSHAKGKYFQFLNCGDRYYNENVLKDTAEFIRNHEKDDDRACIFYGSQYNDRQQCVVTSAPEINDFSCFRNVPCHQVCFYDSRLFSKRSYRTEYRVRADYEHFLYCIYEEKAETAAMPVTVCHYEGGGFSETPENREISKQEHREITDSYMGRKAKWYRFVMILSLAPVRTRLAESKTFSGLYNKIKSFFYRKKSNR